MTQEKGKEPYKNVSFGMFESNSEIYQRLLTNIEKKLKNRIVTDKINAAEKGIEKTVIEQTKQLYKHAYFMIAAIKVYQKHSEADAIQALARMGMALDKPDDEDNLKQLALLVDKLNDVKPGDAGQETIAAARARKALAISIASFLIAIGLIAVAIMFPPAALITGILAGTVLSLGYLNKTSIDKEQALDVGKNSRQSHHETNYVRGAKSLAVNTLNVLGVFKNVKETLSKNDPENTDVNPDKKS